MRNKNKEINKMTQEKHERNNQQKYLRIAMNHKRKEGVKKQ